ncbi:carbohydrate ABC transporter permease [Umezawaea endophytica]|uniref:Sugar ABC transporter permease n=1 Tax=Umezawaea endophytica TaxID=1654476 RepID=A0A9X2ZXX6_9PSEU|nr:sugar ABC transporter permease [Umezawaea endophytica]MCS7475829.1 sugar ABC transporter permease [Umezawaea endophytica]
MSLAPAAARPSAAEPRPSARRRGGQGTYLLFLVPGAVLLVAVVLVPFAMNVGISLTRWSGVGDPRWIGLENYRRLFADAAFWASFRHNVGLVVAMAVLPTAAGLVVAAALFDHVAKRFGPRAASVLRACFYLPQVLPIAVAGIVWSWILAPKGGALNAALDAVGLGSLARDWLGDPDIALYSVMGVLVWIQLGYPVVIFMAGMRRIDPALLEAAELDGASWFGRFWHVTVPQIRPELFVVLLTCSIAALKVFGPIYVLTGGGPGGATTVPSYSSFQNFFEKTQVGYGAAIATVLTVLILLLTTAFLRAQSRGEER